MSTIDEPAADPSRSAREPRARRPHPPGRIRPVTLIALGLVVVVATLALAARGVAWMRRVEQPLAFDHRLHIEEIGLDCLDCHRGAESAVRATIPNVSECGDCHDVALSESPDELALVAYVEAGEKIPWRKVYRVPDHVFFSHRRHTALAGLECEVCHGPVAERSEPISRAFRRPTMNDCMDCHRESQASNDCLYCHY